MKLITDEHAETLAHIRSALDATHSDMVTPGLKKTMGTLAAQVDKAAVGILEIVEELQPAPTGQRLPIERIGEVGWLEEVLAFWSDGTSCRATPLKIKTRCNTDPSKGVHLTHFAEILPAPQEEPATAPSKPVATGSASADLAGDSEEATPEDNSCGGCGHLPTCTTHPLGYCSDHVPRI